MEKTSEEKLKLLQEKHNLTKEYLRRSLFKLRESINFFDSEMVDIEEEEEKIVKFIGEVKRRNLV